MFEWLCAGATPGKRWCNLQVIGADLMPLSAAQAAWRNVLRYLDWLPAFFAVGTLALLVSPKNQRLGDWMAGTVVIFRKAPAPAARCCSEAARVAVIVVAGVEKALASCLPSSP